MLASPQVPSPAPLAWSSTTVDARSARRVTTPPDDPATRGAALSEPTGARSSDPTSWSVRALGSRTAGRKTCSDAIPRAAGGAALLGFRPLPGMCGRDAQRRSRASTQEPAASRLGGLELDRDADDDVRHGLGTPGRRRASVHTGALRISREHAEPWPSTCARSRAQRRAEAQPADESCCFGIHTDAARRPDDPDTRRTSSQRARPRRGIPDRVRRRAPRALWKNIGLLFQSSASFERNLRSADRRRVGNPRVPTPVRSAARVPPAPAARLAAENAIEWKPP